MKKSSNPVPRAETLKKDLTDATVQSIVAGELRTGWYSCGEGAAFPMCGRECSCFVPEERESRQGLSSSKGLPGAQ